MQSLIILSVRNVKCQKKLYVNEHNVVLVRRWWELRTSHFHHTYRKVNSKLRVVTHGKDCGIKINIFLGSKDEADLWKRCKREIQFCDFLENRSNAENVIQMYKSVIYLNLRYCILVLPSYLRTQKNCKRLQKGVE